MPESRCSHCQTLFYAATQEGLINKELNHYRKSVPIEGETTFHSCKKFIELDGVGQDKIIRLYGNNQLLRDVFVKDIGPIIDGQQLF